MATPIRHTTCGKIVMWYVGDKDENAVRSRDIVYLDGTRPMPCSSIPACPLCGGNIHPHMNLVRCFDEDVYPGFDIQEAANNGELVNLPPGPSDPEMVAMLTQGRDMARLVLFIIAVAFLVVMIVVVTK